MALYDKIPDPVLRQHQIASLSQIIPLVEELGPLFSCHPNNPPFPLLSLPCIISTEEDYLQLTQAVDSPSNGITLCTGSLGVRADYDLPGMMTRLGDKVHFIHLRNVERKTDGTKIVFHEATHLEGLQI